MLKISCDDGSTNVKLAWEVSGEIKTFISGNSFKEGWSAGILGSSPVYNYIVDGKKYSYDKGSIATLGTTHVSYQYSTTNLLAIHHALLTSGLAPQDIEITVTLPITEFFDQDNQPNEKKIEAKKKNVLRTISLNKGDVFSIKKVNVMPESIPAVYTSLMNDGVTHLERSLIIDLGGTTADFGLIIGAFDSISEVKGNAEIGTSRITKSVMQELANASTPSNYYVADELIKNRDNHDFLNALINDEAGIERVLGAIQRESKSLAESIQNEIMTFASINRIYLAGGGAELIYPFIKEMNPQYKVQKIEDPQFALAKAMVKA
ncbi:plasmid segregation protein ParM domain-containing protein [Klebsiella sp. PL-2018]|uniref:plasmid segregation protein ParM domain-containing protein n=1 Tax=Klebsiella sp. PL-2018 TaxID=2851540 RepID=UPI001C242E87|nr:plasmid segregation protein ParM domain-containing protein [Klebsiella sp. PL-2018]QXD01251.1 Putative stability/partitioning protein encoded within prophage [Klebsiella sp. PL-2018]